MINQDDISLARAGAAHDDAALAAIVRRHQAGVRTFLRRLCGDAAWADDLAQETFLAAFDRLATYRGESTLASWLCGIAYRRFTNDRRSHARRAAREQVIETAGVSALTDVQLDIKAAFDALPTEQRAAAALCLLAEFSHAEAALALGVPLGTLKSRVAAAKQSLSDALRSYR